MSNKVEAPSEMVKLRHQTWVDKKTAEAFMAECKKKRWEPGDLLRSILEERYNVSEQ